MPHRVIWRWCIGRWWVDCYIWYSDEGTTIKCHFCSHQSRLKSLQGGSPWT